MKRLPLLAALLAGCAFSPNQIQAPPVTAEVPRGRLLYVSRDDAGFRIERLDIGLAAPVTLVRSPEPLSSPRWSPDGTRFAYVAQESGKAALVVQALGGLPRKPVTDAEALSAPAWSPDGTQLAVGMERAGNTDLYLLSLERETMARLTQEPGIETDPAFSPDGRELVYSANRDGGPSQLYSLTLRNAKVHPLPGDTAGAQGASFSPDGRSVVFVMHAEAGDSIQLLDLESGELLPLSPGPQDSSPVFSPSGRFVAYIARSDAGHAIELVSSDGRVRQSLPTSSDVNEPSWTRPLAH